MAVEEWAMGWFDGEVRYIYRPLGWTFIAYRDKTNSRDQMLEHSYYYVLCETICLIDRL